MTHTPTRRRPVARRPRTDADLADRLGWTLVAALTVAVLLSWVPSVGAGLGDNHEGRILGRHALHVTNAQQDGLAGSGWLSDWSPYAGGDAAGPRAGNAGDAGGTDSAGDADGANDTGDAAGPVGGGTSSYAHHPPLMNFGYYLAAQVLPVPTDAALRWFAYLGGVAALPIGAAILRRVGLRWLPILAATSATAITPLFWVYGRLNTSVTLLLAMVLAIVRLREDRDIPTRELVVAGAVSFLAILAGYLGLATAALLGLWLLGARRLDRVTVAVGAAMAVAATITAGYVLAGSGGEEMGRQLELRTSGGGFTAAEFAGRIARWFDELLPAWWRWALAPAALVAGLADRRVRGLVLILTTVAAAYIVGLPNGSFVHDYWIFPVLLPVWFGAAALAQAAEDRWRGWSPGVTAVSAAAVLVVGTTGLLVGQVPQRYVEAPQAAGDLVREVGPAAGQATAWRTGGIATPRWLSWYWDLPTAEVRADTLEQVPAEDLVLVRLDRLPSWLGDPADVAQTAAERRDGYVLVTGEALRGTAATE